MPRSLVVAALSATVVLGCAYPMPRAGNLKQCNSPDCYVSVSVLPGGTGPCIPDTDTSRLEIGADSNAGKQIWFQFALGTTNAGFPSDGIVFDPNAQITCNGAGQPSGQPPNQLWEQFKCVNSRKTGEWKYSVNVVSSNARCETYDPYVVNP